MGKPSYRQYYRSEKPLRTMLGETLESYQIAFETWGRLNREKNNVILLFTGLSASAHAKSHNKRDVPGWWEAMIEPGFCLDTDRYFIICFNYLGGCFGSTGPASINPATGRPYGPDFPPILMQDMADTIKAAVDHMGIQRVFCVMGASMGGMMALEYAARFSETVDRMVMISASGRPGAQSISFRYVQRQVILADPAFHQGWYYDKPDKPTKSMSVARQIGNITYRSPKEFNDRFGRTRTGTGYNFGPDFQVESYLNHMGNKLASQFDANSFLFLTKAMDLYSLGHGFTTYEEGVARIRAKSLILGVTTDALFPLEEQTSVYEILKKLGVDVSYEVLDVNSGHDAFLVEADYFRQTLTRFLVS